MVSCNEGIGKPYSTITEPLSRRSLVVPYGWGIAKDRVTVYLEALVLYHMQTNKKVWDWRSHILDYAPDNSTYKHVLLTLSCYMDSAGSSCYPSIDTLVEVTSLSKPTIIKYLKKAKKDGWLIVEQHGYGDSRWRRNEYTAATPKKVVKQINHNPKGGKPYKNRGKTDNGTRLNSVQKVVKEVNSISSYNSSNNTPKNSGQNDLEKEQLKRMQELFPQDFEQRSGYS